MYWMFVSMAIAVNFGAWPVPLVLLARADHPRRRTVRRALARLDRQALALLNGGAENVVDVVVTDLVERGVLRAERGTLVTAAAAARDDPVEVAMVDAVLEVGRSGLAAVRDHLRPALPALTARRQKLLFRKGLLVTDSRRVRKISAHCLVVLVLGVGSALGSALTTWVPHDPASVTLLVVLVIAWVLPPAILGVRERPGFRGPDRRSALGTACLTRAREALTEGSPQADRVAVWGLASMHDRTLLEAVRG